MAGIPSRIAEVKRDLGAMSTALGSVGGGGSASELRSDAGIFFGYGVEETLSRDNDLLNVQVDTANQTLAAFTDASVVFSFPEDHYILGLSLGLSAGLVANMPWSQLTARPQAGVPEVQIMFAIAADGFDLPGGAMTWGAIPAIAAFTPRRMPAFPLFGLANTDYRIQTRAGAVAITTLFHIYHADAPKGVRIPH